MIPSFWFKLAMLFNLLSRRILSNLIGGTNHKINGEVWIINKIVNKNKNGNFVIMDIGANRGDWSRDVLGLHSSVKVYSFEIIPDFFSQLERHSVRNRQKCFNIGFSDVASKIKINVSGFGAGIHKRRSKNKKKQFYTIECEVMKGDDIVDRYVKDDIDYIKIDVDGMEYNVLIGLNKTINAIRPIIQFEHSPYNYSEGHVFCDFYEYLSNNNYNLFILSSNHLHHIRYYSISHEIFLNKNILAVPREKNNMF